MMARFSVSIARFVSSDPQPGIVEAEFLDADGQLHLIREKTAVLMEANLGEDSPYPQPCLVDVEILATDSTGQSCVIDISKHWGLESVEEKVVFRVPISAIAFS